VTTPEVDALVAIGQADPDVFGARMTGGGFGGCVVMLAAPGRGRTAAERIVVQYNDQVGRTGSILVPMENSS